jgi:hypothetical protein
MVAADKSRKRHAAFRTSGSQDGLSSDEEISRLPNELTSSKSKLSQSTPNQMTFHLGSNNPLPGQAATLSARSGTTANRFANVGKLGKETDFADRFGRPKKGIVSGPKRRLKTT